MNTEMIKQNIAKLLDELPEGVELVAAAKKRAPMEVLAAVDAGIKTIGENYIQEAKKAYELVGNNVKWHFIGVPQRRNIKENVLEMFDMIETVDSLGIALRIDKMCAKIDKVMPILIELNSGREPQKSGVFPEDAENLIKEISVLVNVRVMGLMTMGPRFGNPEYARPYFVETRKIFESIRTSELLNVDMRYLSMGMSNSYRVAIDEGANMVRIGTQIFGDRDEL